MRTVLVSMVQMCRRANIIPTRTLKQHFGIYRVPGHNSAPPANIFRIYKGFAT